MTAQHAHGGVDRVEDPTHEDRAKPAGGGARVSARTANAQGASRSNNAALARLDIEVRKNVLRRHPGGSGAAPEPLLSQALDAWYRRVAPGQRRCGAGSIEHIMTAQHTVAVNIYDSSAPRPPAAP